MGFNKVVRRLLAACGLRVFDLHRESICAISLNDLNVPESDHMSLSEECVEELWTAIGGKELVAQRMTKYNS